MVCELHGHGARFRHHAAEKIVTAKMNLENGWPNIPMIEASGLVVSPWRKWLSRKIVPYS